MFRSQARARRTASVGTRISLTLTVLILITIAPGMGQAPPAQARNGAALGFDGRDDFLSFEDPAGLGLRIFTIEAWFNRQGAGRPTLSGPGGVHAVPLVSRGRHAEGPGRGGLNYFLGIGFDDGVLVADFQNRLDGRHHPVMGRTPIPLDTWNHAAMTYDGSALRLFLNGRLEAESRTSRTPRVSGREPAAIATTLDEEGIRAGFFHGFVDEVRVWKRARSVNEIAGEMGREIEAPSPGLVARWGMNEGSGDLVLDSRGRHPSRILFGARWVAGSPMAPTTAAVTIQQCVPTPSPLSPVIGLGSPMRYLANGAPPEDLILVGPGTAMQYLANTSDPMIDPVLDWTRSDFVPDGTWGLGAYGVGYEASPPGAQNLLTTTVAAGSFSVFTRAQFQIADTSQVTRLLLGADFDDGFAAWINGVEVFRSPQMPAGDPAWNTNTLAGHESSNGTTPVFTPLQDISLAGIPALQNGTNVLAIGVWNFNAPASSDLVLVPRLSVALDWTSEGFDDSGWAQGTYGVGYETSPPGALNLLQTLVPAGTFSIFTRARFDIPDALSVTQLVLGADYDDGFAAWINGVEVFRSPELPPGDLDFNTNAGLHESSNGLNPDFGVPIDISTVGIGALHDGENVLMVGVWNSNAPASTDLVLVPQLSVQSTVDLCDGLDNDCDGEFDEDHTTVPTTCGVGVCAGNTGAIICLNGTPTNTCLPFAGASFETVVVDFDSAMRYQANTTPVGAVVISSGSAMTYLANASDPNIDPVTDWVRPDFVPDASWRAGTYGVGYETAPPGAVNLLQTTVPPGTFSVYTRATFTITDRTLVTSLRLGADYDDGFAAWINGVEVFRSAEMPAGDPTWNTIAALHESSNGAVPNFAPVRDISAAGIGALQDGLNVLAIGVWNRDPAAVSTDLVLVPQLTIVRTTDPDWTNEVFDDSGWNIGVYGVGYEAAPPGASNLIQTPVPAGSTSIFTRARFDITGGLPTRVTLSVDYDDGFIAWINGVEVFGSLEMPSGPVTGTTVAMLHESSNGIVPDFSRVLDISARAIPALHAGSNVLAIGVWNINSASSDLVLVPRLSFGEADPCDGLDNDCDGTADEGFPNNDADGRADCVDPDDDNDGVPDVDDCHPFDPTMTGGGPPEVQRVRWERLDRSNSVIAWRDLGVGMRYDVAGNLISGMLADRNVTGAICVADDVPGTSIGESVATPVAGVPTPGLQDGYYFIVRAQKNGCGSGSGSYGRDSLGNERIPSAACP